MNNNLTIILTGTRYNHMHIMTVYVMMSNCSLISRRMLTCHYFTVNVSGN